MKLFITGLGRTGTSVVAKFLQEMGYELGNPSFNEVAKAGMENIRAWKINEQIWTKTRQGIEAPVEDYKKDIEALDDLEIVKDPRLMWSQRAIEIWKEVIPDIKVLVLHRDPSSDVIYSREQVGEGFADPYRGCDAQLYRDDFCAFMSKLSELNVPFRLMLYPDFLKTYDKVYENLTALGLELDKEKGREVWNNLIDLSMVTQRKEKPKYVIEATEGKTAHLGAIELMRQVANWDDGGLVFSKTFLWSRWGLLGILADYVLYYTQGDIAEVGVCESSIFFTKLAEKYNRKAYHCDIQQSVITNCKTVKGYFGADATVHLGSSDEFFEKIVKGPIALGFIDGDHLYPQVKKDFENMLDIVIEGGYIFLHDTYPPDKSWTGESGCGTVYKLRQELEQRDDLECFTFDKSAIEVGLTMVRKLPKNLPECRRRLNDK